MNEQTCCFSGHRHLPKQETLHIHNLLVKHILKTNSYWREYFICGGALGFDTLAALAVLKIRSIYPHIQLILALPSPQQTNGWSSNDIAVYQSILKQANQIIYMSQEHHSGCMHMRNHYMVDNSLYPYLLPGKSNRRHCLHCAIRKKKTDTFLILPMNHNLFENNIIRIIKRQPFDSCLL